MGSLDVTASHEGTNNASAEGNTEAGKTGVGGPAPGATAPGDAPPVGAGDGPAGALRAGVSVPKRAGRAPSTRGTSFIMPDRSVSLPSISAWMRSM